MFGQCLFLQKVEADLHTQNPHCLKTLEHLSLTKIHLCTGERNKKMLHSSSDLAQFPVEEQENVKNNLFTFKKCALFTLDIIQFWILCSYVFIIKQFAPFSVHNWIRQETFDECRYRVQVGHQSFNLLYRRSNYCELTLQQPVSLPVVEPFLLAEPNK